MADLYTLRILTLSDAEYRLPDMTKEHIAQVTKQLEVGSDRLIAINVSEATLLIPFRIISLVESWRKKGHVQSSEVLWERRPA